MSTKKTKSEEIEINEKEIVHEPYPAYSIFKDEAGTYKVVKVMFCKVNLIPISVEVVSESDDYFVASDEFKIRVVQDGLL